MNLLPEGINASGLYYPGKKYVRHEAEEGSSVTVQLEKWALYSDISEVNKLGTLRTFSWGGLPLFTVSH
jgi:hypothetical protein